MERKYDNRASVEEMGPFSLEAFAKTNGKSSCKADVTPHKFNEGDEVRLTNPSWETCSFVGKQGGVFTVYWVSWDGYEWKYCLAKTIPRKHFRSKREPYYETYHHHWVRENEIEKVATKPQQTKIADMPEGPDYPAHGSNRKQQEWDTTRRLDRFL